MYQRSNQAYFVMIWVLHGMMCNNSCNCVNFSEAKSCHHLLLQCSNLEKKKSFQSQGYYAKRLVSCHGHSKVLFFIYVSSTFNIVLVVVMVHRLKRSCTICFV